MHSLYDCFIMCFWMIDVIIYSNEILNCKYDIIKIIVKKMNYSYSMCFSWVYAPYGVLYSTIIY